MKLRGILRAKWEKMMKSMDGENNFQESKKSFGSVFFI